MGAIAGISCQEHSQQDIVAILRALLADAAPTLAASKRVAWTDGLIGLGAVPLSSRSAAANIEQYQPHGSPIPFAIAGDVRLDNRNSLCDRLRIPAAESGHLSDSHLIVRAYGEWGSECPVHLLGDFAFAIWDPVQHHLFCARDPIGAKRFYYSRTPEFFAFGTDLGGLLRTPGISDAPNPSYVAAHLLDVNFEHPEQTFFASIRKLPPAHHLIVRNDSVNQQRYWDPADAARVRLGSDSEYAEAFLEIFRDSVSVRLRDSAGVGAHITGGLDSSSIAMLAARELQKSGKSLTGFCWEPPLDALSSLDGDERKLIAAVCRQESLPLHSQTLGPSDLVSVLQRDVRRAPTVDTLLHEQIVQKQAEAEGVDVMLSGWGGDELIGFNGRGYLPELLMTGRWRRLFRICRQRAPGSWRYVFRHAVLPCVPAWLGDRYRRFRNQRPFGDSVTDYLRQDRLAEIRAAAAPLLDKRRVQVGVRRTQLRLLELGHLTRRIESWAAAAAQHQLEYRYPLLDKRVIEFALGVPPEQYLNGAMTRVLMRNAVAGLVPSEVRANRDKSDPARSGMLQDVTPEAYRLAATRLAEARNPAGSEYVDVDRLLKRLQSAEPIVGVESNHVWHLLQFLNF